MLEPRSPHLRWRQNRVLQPPSPPEHPCPTGESWRCLTPSLWLGKSHAGDKVA